MTSQLRTLLASLTTVAALGSVLAGCGASEATTAESAAPSSASPSASASAAAEEPTELPTEEPTATPTPEPGAGGTGCGADLEAAVQERSPEYGEVAVDRCDSGWAYVGAKQGMGDTEQVWRVEAGAWMFVTGQPSELCPADLAKQGAPQWVVDLFAYRDYAC